MTTFSSLFQSGTAFYGDPFGPILDTITDFGWSLLPQFPGSIRPGSGGGGYIIPAIPGPVELPPIPVVIFDPGPGIEAETTYVPPVFARPVGTGGAEVRRETVIVGDVATEVERHPEGDFPAGSIFAPGATWGEPAEQHDLDATIEDQEMAIDWGGIFETGIEILTGQAPWQGQQQIFGAGIAQPPARLPAPSGIPGQPTTIYGYKAGTAVTSGDMCGNRRYVTLDRETGKISCKRRRRRRLLTNRDLADLASLKTITGGGAALNSAVIRAVR